MAPDVTLYPWSPDDLWLELAGNAPEMKHHLGGVEPEERIRERHRRSLELPTLGTGQMFRVALPGAPGAGSVGYWEREWQGEPVYEMGWFVLPEHQGRGAASAAVQLAAAHAARHGRHRYAHAYPKVSNAASNAVCRKAGFTLLGETGFEFPKGNPIRCHDWRLDLHAGLTPQTAISGTRTPAASASFPRSPGSEVSTTHP